MGLFNFTKKQADIPQEEKDVIESSNGELTFQFISLNMVSPSHCRQICPGKNECTIFLHELRNGSYSTEFNLSTVSIIVINETNAPIDVDYNNFKAIDVDGFTYPSVELCNEYSFNHISHNYTLPPFAKAKFDLLFSNVEKSIKQITYTYRYNSSKHLSLNFKEREDNMSKEEAVSSIIAKLEQTISDLEEKLAMSKQEYEECRRQYYQMIKEVRENTKDIEQPKSLRQRMDESTLVKYKIVEDDDYWRIFSLEENDTISFNREFDKSKDNHNWINEGDPLVTLKVDNVVLGLNAPTIIKSLVSGLFEYTSNKMIQYNEEICRIRKYDQKDKEHVIEQIEKEEIKQAVLKKERKKMIERETLDELISEGKVFNVYTKENGTRTTIPMEVASAVWNRDGGKCCICGSKKELEFDHIIPISKGGATTFRNLQLLCKNCNIKKSDNI